MKIVIIAALLLFILFPTVFYLAIIISSIFWLVYTIWYIVKLRKILDKKIVTNDLRIDAPNNNHPYNIRYLYSKKVDYKVFISTILELLNKKRISLVRYNKTDYHFIDNKEMDIELTKVESSCIKFLFNQMGDKEKLSLKNFSFLCKQSPVYVYECFKEWISAFEYENAPLKYFKRIKPLVDDSLFYFVVSMIIVISNVAIKYFLIALFVFIVTSYIIVIVNNYANLEEESKSEYIEWLKYKNYINKYDNDLDELDIESLDNLAMYAYVLDEYESFINILNKRYEKNKDIDNDVILSIMHLRIFEDIEYKITSGLKTSKYKSMNLFKGNKGKGF